jgi:predicted ATPase
MTTMIEQGQKSQRIFDIYNELKAMQKHNTPHQ